MARNFLISLTLFQALTNFTLSTCDVHTCEYCCIDLDNGQECRNDVFRCKLDKKNAYTDLYTLILLLVGNLLGVGILLQISWLFMFKIIYKERTFMGWVLVVLRLVKDVLWKQSLKSRLQKLMAVKIRQRSLESSSYVFMGPNVDLDESSEDDLGESKAD